MSEQRRLVRLVGCYASTAVSKLSRTTCDKWRRVTLLGKGELKFAIATSPFVSHLRVRVCHYSATHERDVSYGTEIAVEAASSIFRHII